MTPREQELLQTVNELRTENALLRQKIDLLVKRVFGSSSVTGRLKTGHSRALQNQPL